MSNAFISLASINSASLAQLDASARSLVLPFTGSAVTVAAGDAAAQVVARASSNIEAWVASFAAHAGEMQEWKKLFAPAHPHAQSSAAAFIAQGAGVFGSARPGVVNVPYTLQALGPYLMQYGGAISDELAVERAGDRSRPALRRAFARLVALGDRYALLREIQARFVQELANWNRARGLMLTQELAEVVDTQREIALVVQDQDKALGELADVVDVGLSYVEIPDDVRAALSARLDNILESRANSLAVIGSLIDKIGDQFDRITTGSAVVDLGVDAPKGITASPALLLGVAAALAVLGGK